MKTKTIANRILWALAALFLTVLVCFRSVPINAFADEAEIEYSSVMDDLEKDESFNVSNYPTNVVDYSLQVIQIAESVNNELFVYVYQPSGESKNLKASSINISLSRDYNIDVYNYSLEYLNSNGVFYKYKVNGLVVSNNATRYYTIVSIFRPFDSTIDKQASGGNTVTEVVYGVSKEYCFGELNGTPYVNCLEIETIEITEKFVGYVNYPDGYLLVRDSCHSHFVAFDTDKPIDKLLEADVYYTTKEYSYAYTKDGVFDSGTETHTYGDLVENYAYLKYTQKAEYDSGGFFGKTYTWDRIQSVEDFIATEDRETVFYMIGFDITTRSRLTDEALAELEGKKWVLRFAETETSDYSYSSPDATTFISRSSSTLVGDVTILRLKFETDGITYNLGVIDNKQTGSSKPVNEWETIITPSKSFWTIFAVIAVILLFALLMPIITPIVSLVLSIIELLFKWLGGLFKGDKKE